MAGWMYMDGDVAMDAEGRELVELGLSQQAGITRVCGKWSCKQSAMHIRGMCTLLACYPS